MDLEEEDDDAQEMGHVPGEPEDVHLCSLKSGELAPSPAIPLSDLSLSMVPPLRRTREIRRDLKREKKKAITRENGEFRAVLTVRLFCFKIIYYS